MRAGDGVARVPVYFLCISALEIVNCWTHHSSVYLDGLEHDPCVVSWALAVPSVGIMYAARVHVRRDTLACLCLMCRLCPTEAIDQDPCNGGGLQACLAVVCDDWPADLEVCLQEKLQPRELIPSVSPQVNFPYVKIIILKGAMLDRKSVV